eukprot:scaffold128_cov248-Pinguiococcus_pyrenoidosus.AAC.41
MERCSEPPIVRIREGRKHRWVQLQEHAHAQHIAAPRKSVPGKQDVQASSSPLSVRTQSGVVRGRTSLLRDGARQGVWRPGRHCHVDAVEPVLLLKKSTSVVVAQLKHSQKPLPISRTGSLMRGRQRTRVAWLAAEKVVCELHVKSRLKRICGAIAEGGHQNPQASLIVQLIQAFHQIPERDSLNLPALQIAPDGVDCVLQQVHGTFGYKVWHKRPFGLEAGRICVNAVVGKEVTDLEPSTVLTALMHRLLRLRFQSFSEPI